MQHIHADPPPVSGGFVAGRNAAALTSLVEARFPSDGRKIDVLEIGGGPMSRLGYANSNFTVLEVSEDSLQGETYADETIIGDILTLDLGERAFDIVVFFNVLEHVSQPTEALTRAAAVLRPGGLVVLAGPEPASLKGIITRVTPHPLHVLFYRTILGDKQAGTPGFAPFPTHLAPDAKPPALIRTMAEQGCHLIYDERYFGPNLVGLRKRSRILYEGYQAANSALRLVSGGRLGPAKSDFVLVFSKGETATA